MTEKSTAQTATAANGTPSPESLSETLLRRSIEAANERVEEAILVGTAIRALESLKIASNLILEVRARAIEVGDDNSAAAAEVLANLPDIDRAGGVSRYERDIARLTRLLS